MTFNPEMQAILWRMHLIFDFIGCGVAGHVDVTRGFPRRVFLCNLWCSWERYLHQLPPPHFAPLFINALPWNDIYNRNHFACPSVRPPIEWKCAVPVPKLSAFVLMTSIPLSSPSLSFLPSFLLHPISINSFVWNDASLDGRLSLDYIPPSYGTWRVRDQKSHSKIETRIWVFW